MSLFKKVDELKGNW